MSITGEEFTERLRKSPDLLTDNLRNALARAANRMMTSAKVNATTFPRAISGNLFRSIQGIVLRSKTTGEQRLLLRAGANAIATSTEEQTADVVYARVQELGGGPFRIKKKRYLGRARDKHLPQTAREMDKALKFALEGKKFT